MAEVVNLELIDRNKLISELMRFEVESTGFGRRNLHIEKEVERLIREEVVQLVREMPYYKI